MEGGCHHDSPTGRTLRPCEQAILSGCPDTGGGGPTITPSNRPDAEGDTAHSSTLYKFEVGKVTLWQWRSGRCLP